MIDYNKLQDDHWGNCTSNPEIGVTCAREHNSVCSGRASHDLGVCVEFLFQKKTPPNLAVSAVSATFLCHLNHLVWFEWQRDRFLMLWLLWLKIRNDLLCHNDLWRGVFGVTGVTTAMCHTHKGWVYPFPTQCKAQGQTVVTETLEPPELKLLEKNGKTMKNGNCRQQELDGLASNANNAPQNLVCTICRCLHSNETEQSHWWRANHDQ